MAIVYFRLSNPRRASKPSESQHPAGNYYIKNMPGMNTAANVCRVIDEPNLKPVADRIEKMWMQYGGGNKQVVDMHTGKELTEADELSDFAQTKLTCTLYSDLLRPDFPFGSAKYLTSRTVT